MVRTLRSQKRKPTHPGAILREDVFSALGLSQGDIAERLGVSRRTISQILNEHRPVTPDMAIRLARLLGGEPTVWLNMQMALDLWELEQDNGEYDWIDRVA